MNPATAPTVRIECPDCHNMIPARFENTDTGMELYAAEAFERHAPDCIEQQ